MSPETTLDMTDPFLDPVMNAQGAVLRYDPSLNPLTSSCLGPLCSLCRVETEMPTQKADVREGGCTYNPSAGETRQEGHEFNTTLSSIVIVIVKHLLQSQSLCPHRRGAQAGPCHRSRGWQ